MEVFDIAKNAIISIIGMAVVTLSVAPVFVVGYGIYIYVRSRNLVHEEREPDIARSAHLKYSEHFLLAVGSALGAALIGLSASETESATTAAEREAAGNFMLGGAALMAFSIGLYGAYIRHARNEWDPPIGSVRTMLEGLVERHSVDLRTIAKAVAMKNTAVGVAMKDIEPLRDMDDLNRLNIVSHSALKEIDYRGLIESSDDSSPPTDSRYNYHKMVKSEIGYRATLRWMTHRAWHYIAFPVASGVSLGLMSTYLYNKNIDSAPLDWTGIASASLAWISVLAFSSYVIAHNKIALLCRLTIYYQECISKCEVLVTQLYSREIDVPPRRPEIRTARHNRLVSIARAATALAILSNTVAKNIFRNRNDSA